MTPRLIQLGITDRQALAAARQRGGGESALTETLLRALGSVLAPSRPVLLSTCERLEVYAVASAGETDELTSVLSAHVPAALPQRRVGRAAVAHLFAVAAGLESRFVGEPQILEQVARAPRRSGCRSGLLLHLFLDAVASAERVRSESGLDRIAASCVDLAVRHAQTVAQPDRPAAVLGSGMLATEIASRLIAAGIPVTIVARHPEQSARVLPARTSVVSLDVLGTILPAIGLLVAATSSSSPVVKLVHVRHSSGPLALIDLGVPANIDPGVLGHTGVSLTTLDDLLAGHAQPREVLALARAASQRSAAVWSRHLLGRGLSSRRDRSLEEVAA